MSIKASGGPSSHTYNGHLATELVLDLTRLYGFGCVLLDELVQVFDAHSGWFRHQSLLGGGCSENGGGGVLVAGTMVNVTGRRLARRVPTNMGSRGHDTTRADLGSPHCSMS